MTTHFIKIQIFTHASRVTKLAQGARAHARLPHCDMLDQLHVHVQEKKARGIHC